MNDKEIMDALAEVGAGWLMDSSDGHCQSEALRHLVAAVKASEMEQRAKLQDMLHEVGRWDFRGRNVAETYDMTHGAGSWRRALRD